MTEEEEEEEIEVLTLSKNLVYLLEGKKTPAALEHSETSENSIMCFAAAAWREQEQEGSSRWISRRRRR